MKLSALLFIALAFTAAPVFADKIVLTADIPGPDGHPPTPLSIYATDSLKTTLGGFSVDVRITKTNSYYEICETKSGQADGDLEVYMDTPKCIVGCIVDIKFFTFNDPNLPPTITSTGGMPSYGYQFQVGSSLLANYPVTGDFRLLIPKSELTDTPEPSTWVLMGFALLAAFGFRRRRQIAHAKSGGLRR
jgi:hypothetical protein